MNTSRNVGAAGRTSTATGSRVRGNPTVILYSTSLHTWEVWKEGRPLGHGSLSACLDAYPDSLPVSDHQRALSANDPHHDVRSGR